MNYDVIVMMATTPALYPDVLNGDECVECFPGKLPQRVVDNSSSVSSAASRKRLSITCVLLETGDGFTTCVNRMTRRDSLISHSASDWQILDRCHATPRNATPSHATPRHPHRTGARTFRTPPWRGVAWRRGWRIQKKGNRRRDAQDSV